MKKTTMLILGVCATLLLTPILLHAQKPDNDRMNRDINIAENILGELFRLQTGHADYGFARFTTESVKGSYLPDYGIIFNIEGPQNSPLIITDENERPVSFYYNNRTNEKDAAVNEDSIVERMKEFLKNYGSTLTQLKPSENITLLYNFKNHNLPSVYFSGNSIGVDSKAQKPLPVLSLSAKFSDITGYKEGKLKDSEFDKRIQVSKSDREENLDLKIFAGIFETAFAKREKEQFRISGKADYAFVGSFGALFNFKTAAPAGDGFTFGFGNSSVNIGYYLDDARIQLDDARLQLDAAKIQLQNLFNAPAPDSIKSDTIVIKIDKKVAENKAKAEQRAQKKKEADEKTAAAYSLFKQQMKEYLMDYGGTLSSIKPDQFIFVMVDLPKNDLIPEAISFQLKKAVIEEYNNGKITRQQALNKIVLTES